MIIVLIYQAVLIMNNQYTCKESIISLYICGSVLICSVQCVRNGYDWLDKIKPLENKIDSVQGKVRTDANLLYLDCSVRYLLFEVWTEEWHDNYYLAERRQNENISDKFRISLKHVGGQGQNALLLTFAHYYPRERFRWINLRQRPTISIRTEQCCTRKMLTETEAQWTFWEPAPMS